MGKKMSITKGRLYSSLIYPAAVLLFVSGCATSSASTAESVDTRAPITIQQSDSTPDMQQNKDSARESASDTARAALQAKAADEAAPDRTAAAEKVKDIEPSEPRIFFEPSKSDINEVLGIDFTLAENGKSRLIVTTAKKTEYDLDRKDEKTLILKIHDSTIANPLLMRHIDTTEFQSAVEGIKQEYSAQKKEVDLILYLREIVPFNVKPAESGITIDFGQTNVKVAEKTIIPLDLAETETSTLSVKSGAADASVAAAAASPDTTVTRTDGKRYKGEKMYLDFTDTDVTYILKLIHDVSGKNIVWDPAITGQKVSMVLRDIPWDQALALVVENYNLGMWEENNIITVTTKEKFNQREAEKEAAKQKVVEEQTKVDSVKRVEYIKVRYANVKEVLKHICTNVYPDTCQDGSAPLSADERSSTIMVTDGVEKIELAKDIVRILDMPTCQIMIKARVVSATKTFTRNLGVIWNSPGTSAVGHFGDDTWTGAFSTDNLADNWNDGSVVNFATITGSIGNLSLDASLALAEKDGDITTLSEPKVITRNGTTAVIRNGETIITAPTENVESKTINADLSLSITPNVMSDSDYVIVTTEITDDQIITASQLKTKSIKTDLLVKSGETIIIGGILTEEEQDNVAGVPVLKDIPGLGWLFKNKYKMKEQTELLIFLTPTIVRYPVEDID